MLKTLFKDSLIYGSTSLLVKLFWLLSLPVFTRFIAPEQLAILELIFLMSALLSPFITLESIQGFGRFYQLKEDKLQQQQWISSLFWFNIGMLVIFTTLSLWGSELWLSLFWQQASGNTLWILATFYVVFSILFNLFSVIMRWQNRPMDFFFMYATQSTIGVGVALLLVIFSGWGIIDIIRLYMIATAMAVLWGLWCNKTLIIFALSVDKLKQMLSYSFPLIPTVLSFALITWIDRLMIVQLLDLQALGIYSSAFRMAGIGGLLVMGFQFALGPYVFQRYDEPQTPINLANLFRFIVAMTLLVLLFCGLFAEELISRLLGRAYSDSMTLFAPLSIATCLSQLIVFAPGLNIRKKTWTICFIYTLMVLFNSILNYAFIPLLGLWGAVLATLIGSITTFVIMIYFNQKNYPIPYRFLSYIMCFGYAVFAYVLALFLPFEGPLEWLCKIGLCLGMVACCFLTQLVRFSDFQALKRSLR